VGQEAKRVRAQSTQHGARKEGGRLNGSVKAEYESFKLIRRVGVTLGDVNAGKGRKREDGGSSERVVSGQVNDADARGYYGCQAKRGHGREVAANWGDRTVE